MARGPQASDGALERASSVYVVRGTIERPVRRFLSATPASLLGSRHRRSVCVPHRHARNHPAGICAEPPSRRETIFCGPRRRELTSFSRNWRRSRLAATPRGVSMTERGDDATGFAGADEMGRWRLILLGFRRLSCSGLSHDTVIPVLVTGIQPRRVGAVNDLLSDRMSPPRPRTWAHWTPDQVRGDGRVDGGVARE
jgi:hypothetical protein